MNWNYINYNSLSGIYVVPIHRSPKTTFHSIAHDEPAPNQFFQKMYKGRFCFVNIVIDKFCKKGCMCLIIDATSFIECFKNSKEEGFSNSMVSQ